MTQITHVQVDDELSFLVQVEDSEVLLPNHLSAIADLDLPPGATPTGAASNIVEATRQTITAAIALVRRGMVTTTHPDEFTLEFSIGLKGTAGVPVIVSQSTESTFKISATWKKPKQEEGA